MDNCVKTTTPLSSFSSVQSNLSMAISSPSSAPFLDSLFYCEEQDHPWSYDHNEEHEQDLHLPTINHQDFFWEDEELVHLFTKEQFLSSLHFQQDKPWMIQLLAVTSLSLAAKVEETQVPSLLDLQVEDTKYMFEPKNIQKMELLMMSALEWKMNPVTPISFLDHIVRRLGLKTHLHSIFVKKCEDLILFLVSDSRFVGYQPSVLATAAMLHVIDQVDYFNSVDYQNQLLEVLKTTKEKVKECNEMIMEASHISSFNLKKRKFEEDETMHIISSSSSHHYHRQPPLKKTGIVQQQLGYGSLSCKVPVDVAYIP
ncbi:putative cyclin domain-containing protein [Helianthus annuus]|nr:putative cyclin domain-containing protein [Helianthus annuus]